ncbi:hypothetical protein R1sor_017693 [Riccia sorocarpa]|uniref:Non-structural maintenance of chromosomes element 1 homolog n=1 Tax=Riccia sorocarpa TaxID=122646 RepID=A0ABD3IBK1_9MARC
MGLDVKHHTVLQAVMSRGPLSEDKTHEMYKQLFRVNTLDGFNTILGEINKHLEFVDLEVKRVTDQNDGKVYFGIINKLASPQAKLGTRYSTAQISYFKAVMEAIVLDSSGGGYIQSSRALNLKLAEPLQANPTQSATSQVAFPMKMTLSAKEEALELLIKDQWLSRTVDGGVSLGTRSYLELRGLFRNLEVPFCKVCNEAAIKADLCSNDACSVRMHSYCTAKIFRARQARVCSGCQTQWPAASADNGPVENDQENEEKVVPHSSRSRGRRLVVPTTEGRDTRTPGSQPFVKSEYGTRSRNAVNSHSDSEEEVDDDEEDITRLDSEVEESPRPRKRRLRRGN